LKNFISLVFFLVFSIFLVSLVFMLFLLLLFFFCKFWNSYLFLFFLASFVFPSFGFFNIVFGVFNFNYFFCFWFVCLGKGKRLLCVVGNCSNKNPCHMWVGSLAKWTKNETDIDATLVRVTSSKVLSLLGIPTWGVGYPPHVMTKLKRDENSANLIWASKVSYAKGLRNV
jgi:hypothetical protein